MAHYLEAGQTAQWVQAFATRPDLLSSVPTAHMVEEKPNRLVQAVLCSGSRFLHSDKTLAETSLAREGKTRLTQIRSIVQRNQGRNLEAEMGTEATENCLPVGWLPQTAQLPLLFN